MHDVLGDLPDARIYSTKDVPVVVGFRTKQKIGDRKVVGVKKGTKEKQPVVIFKESTLEAWVLACQTYVGETPSPRERANVRDAFFYEVLTD